MFLSLHFRFFVLGLVHYISFTLVLCVSASWLCLHILGVVESFFCFSISFLFQKIQKNWLSLCILHSTCTIFALEYQSGFHIGNIASIIWRKLCISRSSIPHFHGHNAFALIVRCAFYFMLCHNTISCMIIYLFWVINPIKNNA